MPTLLCAISHFSLRYGVLSPERICARARALGYDSVALTDLDNLYGLPEFLYQARCHNLRPIIAVHLSDRATPATALVYAQGHEGFAHLCQILSARHCDAGFDIVQSIDKYKDGIHVITEDLRLIKALRGMVPCFYRIRRPQRVPREIGAWDTPAIVVPEMAFAEPSDYHTHRLLRAIDCNTSLSRLDGCQCLSPHALIEPWERVAERFEVHVEALETAERFGQTLRSRAQFGAVIFPQADSTRDAAAELRYKVGEGVKVRYPRPTDVVWERVEYELGLIERKGFASYFLIVDDIVRQSPRTCGRGSGAASIVAYCLGITNVDPIRYNLMFERFLNEGRTDPPDIDIDFAWDERDGILEYVFRRYGHERAAMVCTHATFGMRAAIREVARVYGLTESEITAVTRKMPWFYHAEGGASIAEEIANAAATRDMSLDPPWPEIINKAQSILGMPSSIGTHPGGVIVTPGPIRAEAPVQMSAKGYPIVQWEKDGVEEMGLVKIDLLGNRSLAVIRDAVGCVRREGGGFDETRWDPAADPATVDLIARGKTMGVFYVESPAMRLLQEKTKAGDFEHLTIHSSLIRPAANRHNREYIRRLHGGEYKPLHPLLEQTLSETYGIMVYQEDVTKVAMQLAGFGVVDAEGLRKILAKKARRGKLEDYRVSFEQGCRNNGVARDVVDAVWDMMMAFSGYSFCKPHSASYCQVSFQSAWLKVHHPAAFMAGVISNFGGFYSTQAYVSEAQRLGLTVVPPDCNTSEKRCYSRGRELVMGLMLIKGLSGSAQDRLIADRRARGAYVSLEDIIQRTGLEEADCERLVVAGACDSLDPERNRPRLFWRLRAACQGIAGEHTTPELRPYSRAQLLAKEYDTLGFLTSTHPITLVRPARRGRAILVRDIRARVGDIVGFYGWCVTSRTLTTEQGAGMQFVTFEDETGIVETVLFPDVYAVCARLLAHREAFLVWGKVTEDFGAVVVEVQGMRSQAHNVA